jgi:hypothetical protein
MVICGGRKRMNYVVAFAICLIGTVLTALTGKDTYWMMVSDGNVALTLFIAWYLDKGRAKGINVNVNVSR